MFIYVSLLFICSLVADPTVTQAEEQLLIRGKSLSEWIQQARSGEKLKDRQDAMQILRSDGLARDRKLVIGVFTECLADKETTIKSLAAAGLIKAGTPADPQSLEKLENIISKEISGLKPSSDEFGLVTRAIRAIGALGGEKQLRLLKLTSEDKNNHVLLRQFSVNAMRTIEKRMRQKANRKNRDNG